jgi:hypothetical protein
MSWLGFDPKGYSRDGWAAHVANTALATMKWKPVGIVMHATGLPTLAMWAEFGPAHDARLKNLQAYYEGMGWQHGPHAFVSRNYINGFSALTQRGTHCSCHNSTHFGIEQVGNYNKGHDDYNSGEGAKVKGNAIWAAAVLCRHFQINPLTSIIPHSECKRDGHSQCPGDEVDMADFCKKVSETMEAIL